MNTLSACTNAAELHFLSWWGNSRLTSRTTRERPKIFRHKNQATNNKATKNQQQAINTTTMPKLKRTSENQITKDSYERGDEDSRFADEPDPGIGMKRATAEQMKGRKIFKASRWADNDEMINACDTTLHIKLF